MWTKSADVDGERVSECGCPTFTEAYHAHKVAARERLHCMPLGSASAARWLSMVAHDAVARLGSRHAPWIEGETRRRQTAGAG
jgi:hypothetical protein